MDGSYRNPRTKLRFWTSGSSPHSVKGLATPGMSSRQSLRWLRAATPKWTTSPSCKRVSKNKMARWNPNKPTRPHGVAPGTSRNCSQLIPSLMITIPSSLQTGAVPSNWKDAHVAPVFKKGEHFDQSKYRPISHDKHTCKVLEHTIVSDIMNHLEDNK